MRSIRAHVEAKLLLLEGNAVCPCCDMAGCGCKIALLFQKQDCVPSDLVPVQAHGDSFRWYRMRHSHPRRYLRECCSQIAWPRLLCVLCVLPWDWICCCRLHSNRCFAADLPGLGQAVLETGLLGEHCVNSKQTVASVGGVLASNGGVYATKPLPAMTCLEYRQPGCSSHTFSMGFSSHLQVRNPSPDGVFCLRCCHCKQAVVCLDPCIQCNAPSALAN